MDTAIDIGLAGQPVAAKPSGPVHWLRTIGHFCRKKPLGALGGLIVVVMILIALLSAVAVIVSNLVVDVTYAYLDPRIRYG